MYLCPIIFFRLHMFTFLVPMHNIRSMRRAVSLRLRVARNPRQIKCSQMFEHNSNHILLHCLPLCWLEGKIFLWYFFSNEKKRNDNIHSTNILHRFTITRNKKALNPQSKGNLLKGAMMTQANTDRLLVHNDGENSVVIFWSVDAFASFDSFSLLVDKIGNAFLRLRWTAGSGDQAGVTPF